MVKNCSEKLFVAIKGGKMPGSPQSVERPACKALSHRRVGL